MTQRYIRDGLEAEEKAKMLKLIDNQAFTHKLIDEVLGRNIPGKIENVIDGIYVGYVAGGNTAIDCVVKTYYKFTEPQTLSYKVHINNEEQQITIKYNRLIIHGDDMIYAVDADTGEQRYIHSHQLKGTNFEGIANMYGEVTYLMIEFIPNIRNDYLNIIKKVNLHKDRLHKQTSSDTIRRSIYPVVLTIGSCLPKNHSISIEFENMKKLFSRQGIEVIEKRYLES